MNDVERYFQDTLGDYLAPRSRMGELSPRGIEYLKHPTRKGEQVGWYGAGGAGGFFVFEFTPDFVKECFEASKDGENPLIDYVSMTLKRLNPKL